MASPAYYFNIWYVEPLMTLQSIPDGNGGFIALATSCFLYERYAKARLLVDSKRADEQNFIKQLMLDFCIDEITADTFWTVIREGLLHQGMPKLKDHKKDTPPWRFLGSFPKPIELVVDNDNKELRIQPWYVMHRVLELWQNNMDLLDKNHSFPWAAVIQ